MKEKKSKIIFILIILVSPFITKAQEERGDIRVMFYNIENLFDIKNNPEKDDDEFIPEGERRWNESKYQSKINNIYKVIINAGIWTPPEIIGLCEIENKEVLIDLLNKSPLYKYDYGIVHYESPDRRGIDVGCFYDRNELELIKSFQLPVIDSEEINFKTRDILYLSLKTKKNDTIHIYINHWPSRSGGQEVSEDKRTLASNTLIYDIKNRFSEQKSNIIIMGDFNDESEDISLKNLHTLNHPVLINLTTDLQKNSGTIKFQENWYTFDQIIVSSSFFDKKSKLSISYQDFHILDFNYLLTDDNTFSGKKPFRTYSGYEYTRGFSDHLPVIVDIWY